jgi:hypothetical protein
VPGYRAIHNWINRHYPRTGRCEYCGSRARRTSYATARKGIYTRNRADWFEFCQPCHRNYDGWRPPTATKGVPMSAEQKAVRSAALKGRPFSPEHAANVAAANQSPAKRQKVTDALKGRPKSPEGRANIAAANRARGRKP